MSFAAGEAIPIIPKLCKFQNYRIPICVLWRPDSCNDQISRNLIIATMRSPETWWWRQRNRKKEKGRERAGGRARERERERDIDKERCRTSPVVLEGVWGQVWQNIGRKPIKTKMYYPPYWPLLAFIGSPRKGFGSWTISNGMNASFAGTTGQTSMAPNPIDL